MSYMEHNQSPLGGRRDGTPNAQLTSEFNDLVASFADSRAVAMLLLTATDGVAPPHAPNLADRVVDIDARNRKIHDEYPGPGHQYS